MVTRGRTSAQASAGRRGRRPLRFARGMGGSGRPPLIRPCGATFPRGGRQGLLLAAAQSFAERRGRRPLRFAREWATAGGRGGVGAPRPTDGDMETLWGLRGHPFPGRRAVGAGHARPGGLHRPPSMVRSVERGLDPSAGVGGSGSLPLIRPCGATFPQGGRQGLLLTAAQASAGRRGRRPLRFAREWAAAGACPSSGPAGPPSPKGEGKGCCWRQREPAPYPGSWSSVRSWRVRL